MKRASKIWLIILVFILPSILTGWGYEGHRRINYLASRQLKGPFGRFLMQHSDKLKLYGPVPDYIKGLDRSGYHHHFIDADFMIPIHLIISQEIEKVFMRNMVKRQ